MTKPIVQGLSLYVRKITARKHGTPKEFARRMRDLGMSWIAIAAVWQEVRADGRARSGMINDVRTCRRYAEALEHEGVEAWVWGYPWLGLEAEYSSMMLEAAAPTMRVLVDDELGANPTRSRGRRAQDAAERHVGEIATRLRAGGATAIGMSTYGVVPAWFPFDAWLHAGVDFVGGQTYTVDQRVDVAIASALEAMERTGSRPQLVPNAGLYQWDRDAQGRRRARPKTPTELRSHLYEFVDEGEPVEAIILWAENFLVRRLEQELARFAEALRRGACRLPVVQPR